MDHVDSIGRDLGRNVRREPVPRVGSRLRGRALGALLVLFVARAAHADTSPADQAAAQSSFDRAMALMTKGAYADACPLFAESMRLDPALGTELHLANCYEKLGRTASAWATFSSAADRAHKAADPRETVAREHVALLEPKLARITLSVATDADAQGLDVKIDTTTVGRPLWSAGTPIDPGRHTVSATAPGKKPWSTTVDVAASGGVTNVRIPSLEDERVGAASHEERAAGSGGSGSALRTTGWVIGAAGVGGLGVGTFFGLKAKSTHQDALASCRPDGTACTQAAVDTNADAKSQATIANVGFIAGGALLAGGVVLVLVGASSSPQSSAIRVAPSVGGVWGLSLGGSL